MSAADSINDSQDVPRNLRRRVRTRASLGARDESGQRSRIGEQATDCLVETLRRQLRLGHVNGRAGRIERFGVRRLMIGGGGR